MRRPLLLVVLCLAVVSVVLASDASADALPKVGFETDSITVSESVGSVGFHVSLSPSSVLTATVAYTTLDGSALAEQDFLSTTGTLTFTPGTTLQTISVMLRDDELPEQDESFSIVLRDPQNAALGVYPTLTVTITDDGDPYLIYFPVVEKRWPPIPYDPTLNAISNPDGDGSYTVSWYESPIRLADSYILQEATDSGFTANVLLVCFTNNQYCAATERGLGTYYYRVKGRNVWGDSQWSNVQSVTTLPPDAPALYAIDNGDGDGIYTVDWSDTARASSYFLEEDDNAAFASPATVYEGAASVWFASGRPAGMHYYRVKAAGSTGSGPWSNSQSVSVLPPAVPTLYPIDNLDGDNSYTVSWQAAARASEYELQEDDNSAFSSPVQAYWGTGLSWSTAGKAVGTYYYRVRAGGPTGASGWSSVQSVRVPGPPLSIGETVRFRGAWEDVPMEGRVTFSEHRTVLVDDYRGPVYPGGVFVVALMDVTNHGLVSDDVGYYSSFGVRDSAGRRFDIADLDVLFAAMDEYDRQSVYEAIQPGFTKPLVFVFDVLPQSQDLHLVSLDPW